MAYRHTLGGETYSFETLKDLLAAASPIRSGDQLAGLCAATDAQRVAARYALADLPCAHSLKRHWCRMRKMMLPA